MSFAFYIVIQKQFLGQKEYTIQFKGNTATDIHPRKADAMYKNLPEAIYAGRQRTDEKNQTVDSEKNRLGII